MSFKKFKDNLFRRQRRGFSLIEAGVSVVLLGIISSSILIVLDRNMAVATESTLKMEAFWVARENLEEILAQKTVTEDVEYGTSEKNDLIQWTKRVEPFYEDATGEMWLKAVSIAEFYNTDGELEEVKLEKWLSPLSDKQLEVLAKRKDIEVWELEQQLQQGEYNAGDEFDDLPGDDMPSDRPDGTEMDNPSDRQQPDRRSDRPEIPYNPDGTINWEELFKRLK